MTTLAKGDSGSKRTGVQSSRLGRGIYEENWGEAGLGDYELIFDGVSHGYEWDPTAIGNHRHYRNGIKQDYGRHAHDRWDDPHRHIHAGDRNPSQARQKVDAPRELPDRERHHSHRTYVLESDRMNEAVEAAVMAVRLASASYEDGRWRDAHGQYADARAKMEAAVEAAGQLVAAMYDLWDDGGPKDRRIVEFESQALGGSLELDGRAKTTIRRRAIEPEGRPSRRAA